MQHQIPYQSFPIGLYFFMVRGAFRMTLTKTAPGHTVKVKSVNGNEKTNRFLFTLGCSEGEEITLLSVLAGNYVIRVKDSRYAIDKKMAQSIEVA